MVKSNIFVIRLQTRISRTCLRAERTGEGRGGQLRVLGVVQVPQGPRLLDLVNVRCAIRWVCLWVSVVGREPEGMLMGLGRRKGTRGYV